MGVLLLSRNMNYGVKRALATGRKGLRKAGTKLQEFDDAYSGMIRDLYKDAGPSVKTAGYMIGGGHPTFRKAQPEGAEGIMKGVMEYGIPAVNAVPKYVLPAVGVGLAAKGVADVAFGGNADTPESHTLPM